MRIWIGLIGICSLFVLNAQARTHQVYPDKDKAIQSSINAASSGDTLIIHAGTYPEHDILIKKKLTLIGNGKAIVDGENKHQLFVIASDYVTIKGLQIQNSGRSSMSDMAAIRVQEAHHVQIFNNTLINNTYGVYIQMGGHCIISNNDIRSNAAEVRNNGNGIHAWKSEYLSIANNHIENHRDGIYFEFVTKSYIVNNTSINNVRYGLHFMFSHDDIYTNNRFTHNGSGVAVMYSKGVRMHNNIFENNWGDAAYAVLLKDISDSEIIHNTFIKNTVGIFMEGSSRIKIYKNEFISNGWAIRVQASCDNNTFKQNNFFGNSFDVATNGTMTLNTFEENYWDKYDGYDMNKDTFGDVPYYPVSVFAVLSEHIPATMILYRSLLADLMDEVEKLVPSIIPDQLMDSKPSMKQWKHQ